MNAATIRNYLKYFGADAFVPGYCGKCPGANKVGDTPICIIYAEDVVPRIIDPITEPPNWCPIRHISIRYAPDHDEQSHD